MPLQSQIPPARLTPEQLYSLLVSIDAKQAQIVRDVTIVRERVEQVEEDQQDLLAAWRAGGAALLENRPASGRNPPMRKIPCGLCRNPLRKQAGFLAPCGCRATRHNILHVTLAASIRGDAT